jgi:hypothetical protein
MRVTVDEVLLIDRWHDGETRTVEAEGHLGSGRHWLRVEYYERGGQAQIKAEWFKKG